MKFYIKTGNVFPPLKARLLQHNNEPIQLTSFDTVKFYMSAKNNRSNLIIDGAPVQIIYDEQYVNHGFVEYQWEFHDTAVSGLYQGEFRIILDDGKEFNVPNNGYIDIIIDHSLKEEEGED